MISCQVPNQAVQAMASRKRPKTYVVQRVEWRYVDRSLPLERAEGAGAPVKVFADRKEAEAYCRKVQRKERRAVNPFAYGSSFPGLDDFTSMPTDEFIASLEHSGIRPPTGQLQQWQQWQTGPAIGEFDQESYDSWWGWWRDSAASWDRKLLDRVWDRLDKVRLFEVVEVEGA
jgi:hypothetical protein